MLTVQSQRVRCVQRRPLERDGEEKAVGTPRDGVTVVLELVSGRIFREKDGVVTGRTDRATVRRGKTTGSHSSLNTCCQIHEDKQKSRKNRRKIRVRD